MQQPLTLDALRVLETIARRGSFAAAAEELHRVTSAVSYTVQKLEEDLDLQLFDRSGHRAKLTIAGKLLVERGRDLLAASNLLVEDARAAACGWESRLSIAIDQVYPEQLLLPLLADFYAAQSEAGGNTDIRVTGEVLTGPWDALESGRADIAIGSGQIALSKAFRKRKLGSMHFVFVAAPTHPIFQHAEPVLHLEDYRALVIADTARDRAPHTTRIGQRQPTLTFSHFTAKIAALEAGLGVGSLPNAMVREPLARGTLQRIASDIEKEHLDLYIAWRADSSGRAQQWFLQHLPAFFAALDCG